MNPAQAPTAAAPDPALAAALLPGPLPGLLPGLLPSMDVPDATAAQLALAVELAQITVWRHDLRIDRMYYNARGFEVLGIPYRPEGLSIGEVRSHIHPDDLPAVLSAARQALHADTPTDMQARYRRSDGVWRYVLTRRVLQRDGAGQPLAFVGVALDVTDQVDQQRRAADTAHRLDIATTAAGIGVWSRDTETEEAHWNAQMFRLCGRDPKLGPPDREQWINELMHPDDRARMRGARPQLMASDSHAVEHEYRVLRPDGEVRWLVNRARLEHWNGRPMIFGATLDVTERRQAEAVQREALAAQRLNEARAQMLGRISHELRTPLNAILGFTQLLELDALGPAPEPLPHARDAALQAQLLKLRHIRNASEHLLNLVNEVLDLSSIEAGQMQLQSEPVALDGLVGEVIAAAMPLARTRGIALFAQTEGLVVTADRKRLHQVLAKLLDHRLPLVPAGGEVHVVVAVDGPDVRLGIADNGHALTAAQQLQLFEPFSRLGAGGGEPDAGLNLALVKALMACMGGRIDLDSSPQGGTRFVLWLPRPTEAPADIDAAAVVTAPPSGKVLYIEDNPVNVILVEELIAQRGGLELACANTGQDGVERARAMRPDLILIDMQLPDFDGFEVLRRLRADPATAATSCIALSANAMPDDVARALAAGFDDYWTKPIRFNRFLAGLDGLFPRSEPDSGL